MLCPTCQQPLPDGAVCPACGAGPVSPVASTPWEERHRLGWTTAMVDTTRLVLTRPSEFFGAMPVSGGIGSPLLYGVIVGWIGAVAASFYQAVFHSVVTAGATSFSDRPEIAEVLNWVGSWAGLVAQVVFGWVMVAIGVMLAAGVFHLMLMLLGGARHGFEATLRVVSYSQATSLALLLPFCGQPIGFIWALVLFVIGLAAAHGTGHGRAAAAVLLPLVVLCCCCGGALGTILAGAAGLASRMP